MRAVFASLFPVIIQFTRFILVQTQDQCRQFTSCEQCAGVVDSGVSCRWCLDSSKCVPSKYLCHPWKTVIHDINCPTSKLPTTYNDTFLRTEVAIYIQAANRVSEYSPVGAPMSCLMKLDGNVAVLYELDVPTQLEGSGGREYSRLGRRLVEGGTYNICKRTIADFAADNFNNSIVNRSENAKERHPNLNARQKRVQRRKSLRGKVSSRRSEYGREAPLVWIYGGGFSKCFVKEFRQSFFVVSTDFVKNSSHSKVKVINNSSSRVEERRIHSNHVEFFGISTTSSAGNTSSHNWSSEQRNKSTHWDNSSSSSQQHQSFRHFYVKNRRIDRKALVSSESTNRQEQGSG
ncbi:hypothetical protein CAEBREN_18841 [Caenorhabditis brenneri]|uniref:PSI domain-containing protein n=1 Tax=Caenorhabditis brenneri TaxID=135651 RepID=G0PGQ8_CAEBE|nr:hypothetical protein CAEBREN_18841 [Caenorhabditis brenneri]